MEIDSHSIPLNETERRQLYTLYMTRPSLRQARQTLLSRLFENPLTLIVPDTSVTFEINPSFSEVLNTYYKDLAVTLLDDYMCFGYSHFYLDAVRFEGKTIQVPKHLPFGQYTVKLVAEPFKDTSLQFVPKGKELSLAGPWSVATSLKKSSKRPKITNATDKVRSPALPEIYPVIFESSILPDAVTGKHYSIVATLLKQFNYHEIRQRFSLQADFLNAFPKVITRTKEKDSKNAADTFDDTTLLDTELIALKEKQRNQIQLHLVRQNQDCQPADRTFVNLIDNDFLELKDLLDNSFHLPANTELASSGVPNAIPSKDLIEGTYHIEKQVLSAFGIPAAFAISQDVSLKNNSRAGEIDARMFFKTVKGYQRIIEFGLQKTFDTIYPSNSAIGMRLRKNLLTEQAAQDTSTSSSTSNKEIVEEENEKDMIDIQRQLVVLQVDNEEELLFIDESSPYYRRRKKLLEEHQY